MFESQAILAAKVDECPPSFVGPMREMPPRASTSGERPRRGATCFFLQFACSAAAMHFGAVKPLLRLVW
jgi:hypothetical protein